MTPTRDDLQCEVCGKLATVYVRDLIEMRQAPDAGWKSYKPGDAHFFCDEHERESVTLPAEEV